MNKAKFKKYGILIIFILLIFNSVLYTFLPPKISLIFLIKLNGEIRNSVNKLIGISVLPIISIFSFITGLVNQKYQSIILIIFGILMLDIIIMILNVTI